MVKATGDLCLKKLVILLLLLLLLEYLEVIFEGFFWK